MKNENVKGVVFDLGYSLNQIKDNKKGLSFSSKGKLNMKLGLNDFSAKEMINKLDSNDLQKFSDILEKKKRQKRLQIK